MKASRFLPALLAGAVGCALALALAVTAAGQTEPPLTPSGSLPSYVEGWSAPADNLFAFTVDARDRVWLLTRDPAFVRLDEQGKVAEQIPFAWPADLSRSNDLYYPFLVAGEDFMVGRYRFDRGGKVIALYPFRQARRLAEGPGGTVVRLMDGLEIYDRKGQLVRRFGEEGLAPGKLETPMGLAVDRRGRIVLAELRRLQLFNPQGKLLRAVGLPAQLAGRTILSLAMDGDGYLYASVSNGGSTVAVFDPDLRYLGSARIGWERHPWELAADGPGRLYALVRGPGRILRQAVPAGGSVRLAKPLPATGGELPRELPQIRPAREEALALSARDQPLLPFRLHASTRGISQVAPDPLVPGRLWLATDGGLVRFDSGSGQWQRWTLADGLPEGEVRSVHSDGRRVWVLLRSSAAVFDLERLRFQPLVARGEGGSPFANAVRVAPAPEAQGVLWWIVGSGVLRQDLAGGSWSSFPVPGEQPVLDGLVLAGGRIAVLTQNEVWELRPEAKEWRRMCDVDDLDRASPARRNPTHKLHLRSLSTTDGGRTFWIGVQGNAGLFRVEAGSGEVSWPEETREPQCWLQRVVGLGDRLFAFGSGCLREIGRPGCCTVDRGQVEEVRQVIPDPGHPGSLWLATRRGLASFRPADGRLAFHLPPWSEPDGVRVASVLAAEGRLWISQRDGGVSAFDPATDRWTTFPELRPAQGIRRSAANGHLLVFGYGGGRALTWIDPKTAEPVLVPGRWHDNPWRGVGDIHHDAQGLWAVGYLLSDNDQGFGVQRSDGTSQIVLKGELYARSNSLLPDPVHPGDFLLVEKGEELLRVHAATGETETLRAKVREIRRIDDRYVWIEGEPSARLDLQTGTLATLDLDGRAFPDLRHPDRVWLLRSNVLTLYDLIRRERLSEIALPGHVGYDELTVLGDRLWIGSWAGLLEVPRPP